MSVERKLLVVSQEAGVVKRSNTTDCKSVGIRLRGFESLPQHHPPSQTLYGSAMEDYSLERDENPSGFGEREAQVKIVFTCSCRASQEGARAWRTRYPSPSITPIYICYCKTGHRRR